MLTNQFKERFDQQTFEKVREVERVLKDASERRDFSLPAIIKDIYGGDLDLARLEVQPKMLPDGGLTGGRVHQIVQALVEAKKSGGSVFERMMSEVITLVRFYLTVPVTTATSERSFSALRRVLTFA